MVASKSKSRSDSKLISSLSEEEIEHLKNYGINDDELLRSMFRHTASNILCPVCRGIYGKLKGRI